MPPTDADATLHRFTLRLEDASQDLTLLLQPHRGTLHRLGEAYCAGCDAAGLPALLGILGLLHQAAVLGRLAAVPPGLMGLLHGVAAGLAAQDVAAAAQLQAATPTGEAH